MSDYDHEKELLEELENFKRDKERIKKVIGSIGGRNFAKKDKFLNYLFLALILTFFTLEITTKFLPTYISLEFAVLLISIKIIWLINNITKMDHFQFWILNSIEFRINNLANKLTAIEKSLNEKKT